MARLQLASLAPQGSPCRSNGCSCHTIDGISRRRRGRAGVGALLFFLALTMTLASSDGLLFKKRAKAPSGSGRGRVGGKDKVLEDVAWLLEDTSDGGWKPVSDDGHVKVWKRSMPGSDFVAIKSSAILTASSQALFEVLTPGDIEIVRQYNPLVEDGRDLEVMDRDNKVSWSATMGIWPCRPRDFVTHIRRATLDDGSVAIVNSATTHPKAPENGQYIRGEILHGVFHIKSAKNKKHSEFTMIHHFNPGGSVPAWLMNWLAEGKPMSFVRRLEEVAEKWDINASSSKNMACKGRGFGDKPCAFLLPSTDGGNTADSSASGGMGARRSARDWVFVAATLATAALVCYGWAVCHGWPLVAGRKNGSSPASEGKNHGGGNGAPAAVDIARTPTAKGEKHVKLSPEASEGGAGGGGLVDGMAAGGDRADVDLADEGVGAKELTDDGVATEYLTNEVVATEDLTNEVAPTKELANEGAAMEDLAKGGLESRNLADGVGANGDATKDGAGSDEGSSGEVTDGEASTDEPSNAKVTDGQPAERKTKGMVADGNETEFTERCSSGEAANVELPFSDFSDRDVPNEVVTTGLISDAQLPLDVTAGKELPNGEVPNGHR